MGNKDNKKKYVIINAAGMLIVLIAVFIVNYMQFRAYEANYNRKLNEICVKLLEEYPQITSSDLISIINSDNETKEDFFLHYGIDMRNDSVLIENAGKFQKYMLLEIVVVFIGTGIIIFIHMLENRRKEKEIIEIARYIEQINKGNYQLKIDDNSEGELSILKNEVYKTTIMLKEAAQNSHIDKVNLKNSLSDISHQLKTPITSLLINLENLEDNPQLDEDTQQKIISNAKRDVNSINVLVQSILKLSKLDANAIEFVRKETAPAKIVDAAVDKVSALADLRGIAVKLEGQAGPNLLCDAYWQIEAISNILKNAVEHAKSCVTVRYESNKVYCKIVIENDGVPISEKDRLHIFERFYKGDNAARESIGIGLSLAKSIIEQDGGYVTVDTRDARQGEGITVFTVKYI